MAVSNERKEDLIKFLSEDKARAEKILSLDPEGISSALKESGMDYSIEELNEFAEEMMKNADLGDELNEDALEVVAGGSIGANLGRFLLILIKIAPTIVC